MERLSGVNRMKFWPYAVGPLCGFALVLPLGIRLATICTVIAFVLTGVIAKLQTGKWFP
jgi:hypothetical protein